MTTFSAIETMELLSKCQFYKERDKFMLSNVLEHNGKRHDLLERWIDENQYRVIEAGVSGWRYAKNEVLIVNY